MLVLGLLVAVAAVALPRFQNTLPTFRLRKSGDIIRQAWNHARIQAMKTGRTYVFKFAMNSRKYKIEPWYGNNDYLEADVQTAIAQQGQGVGAGQQGPGQAGGQISSKKLPEGITFASMQSAEDNREAFAQSENANMPEADMNEQWSRPVVFYPDGTTSSSQITINNQRNAAITVRIRSLTGAVEVTDLTNSDQIPQLSEQ